MKRSLKKIAGLGGGYRRTSLISKTNARYRCNLAISSWVQRSQVTHQMLWASRHRGGTRNIEVFHVLACASLYVNPLHARIYFRFSNAELSP